MSKDVEEEAGVSASARILDKSLDIIVAIASTIVTDGALSSDEDGGGSDDIAVYYVL